MGIDTGFNGNGHSKNDNGETFQHAKVMVDEAKAFGRSLSDSANSLGSAIDLTGRIHRNPIAMILGAVGVGYLLGGGLFTPLTGKLVRIGLRVAILPLVRGPLLAMAGSAGAAVAAGSANSAASDETSGAL